MYIKLRQEIGETPDVDPKRMLAPGTVCDLGRARNEQLLSVGVADRATQADIEAQGAAASRSGRKARETSATGKG